MYIVNTTFVVEPTVQNQWLEIIKDKYIPFLHQSGYASTTFARVISVEAVDHFTYSLQVGVQDMRQYEALTGEIFSNYLGVAEPMFGTKVLWFTSLMKIIE